MTDYGPVLARIAARAAEDEPMLPLVRRPAPLGAAELDLAERTLGFPLHPLRGGGERGVAQAGP
ncbi:hypothetical protein Val02_82690 [Virgisporangium aliadipatigenens]|uniref:Uncharacterized protein n=1 Tax=Virgisporangium aliadipatigenens TaxID=741659 RepID=A0A8J3YXF1_9ACTN|nr:hypothetical protein [Virgisporangium aliadipatigenens]GIJ51383.1 hypothetical protein Val02_82690 [Virgisporangium aliadipatigenens]